MSRGPSGRVIIEIEPAFKRELHARLAAEGRSMKDWFLECAGSYLDPAQKSLPFRVRESDSPSYLQENANPNALRVTRARSRGDDGTRR